MKESEEQEETKQKKEEKKVKEEGGKEMRMASYMKRVKEERNTWKCNHPGCSERISYPKNKDMTAFKQPDYLNHCFKSAEHVEYLLKVKFILSIILFMNF